MQGDLISRGGPAAVTAEAGGRTLAANRVLRNTYLLLAMTLVFSAITAGAAMALRLPHPGLLVSLAGYFGLLFLTTRFRNSGLGVAFVFALTGFLGYTLGPILNAYLGLPDGGRVVIMALGGTAAVFIGLSAYALASRREFSFLGGFLAVGILVGFVAALGAAVFGLPGLSLAVSAMFVLLMSGLILYQTSEIVRGGETNYIMATLTLYVAVFNLFTSLLQLLGFAGREE